MTADLLPRPAERTVLRRLSASDLVDFQAYRQDPEVVRYQGWQAVPDSEAEAFLAAVNTAALLQPGEWSQIGIADRQNNRLIGDIGICLTAEGDEAEVGFSLHRQAQGKGLAREAVREAIRLVFEQTGANRVVCITDARNLPSIRLLERLGLRKTEELQSLFQGEPCTEYVFAITCDEAAGLN